jgi:hypothetical protein
MVRTAWDEVEAAQLLRELAVELLRAEGAARNGLFLELHRLLDTLFRRSLEAHPNALPEIAAQAFALADPLPAPQVVRELNRLGSGIATQEIRGLYKHMNMARNNMAHEAVIERVVVSRANCKRMAHLARLVADALDPKGEGVPSSSEAPTMEAVGGAGRWWSYIVWLGLGMGLGVALGWSWFGEQSAGLATAFVAVGVVASMLLYWNRTRL